MKLKNLILSSIGCFMAYYITLEYAKEAKREDNKAFATIALWQRQEFMRKLLGDARKKTSLPRVINTGKNQKTSK